jgi:hypothetical protein
VNGRKVFIVGLLVSLALVAILAVVALVAFGRQDAHGLAIANGRQSDAARAASALHGLSGVARVLVGVFLVINPVLALVGWLSLALPTEVASSRPGQVAIALSYLVAFVGGWWIVGAIVDHIARRRMSVGR